MGYFDGFYKNFAQKDFFSSAIIENRLSHAYIIEGVKGSGKKTFARIISAELAGGENNPLAAKILSGSSPDVSEYDVPDKKKFIPVETVRNIKSAAYIKPSELDVRIFIINNAQMINVSGQNALLKLLEEPPANVYIFLLCENSSGLLPTVRSRAAAIRMQRFTNDEISEYFSLIKQPLGDNAEYICRASDGSIGRAMELLAEKSHGERNDDLLCIFSSLSSGNFPKLLIQCLALPQERSSFDKSISLLISITRDMLISANDCTGNLNYFISADEALKTKGMLTQKSLLLICGCLLDIRKMTAMNMNIQTLKTLTAKRLMRTTRV